MKGRMALLLLLGSGKRPVTLKYIDLTDSCLPLVRMRSSKHPHTSRIATCFPTLVTHLQNLNLSRAFHLRLYLLPRLLPRHPPP